MTNDPFEKLFPLIGRRVAMRHAVGERDGRTLLSDAVGELSRDGDALVVATRRGAVRIAPDAVRAVRAVPPPVPRRASLAAVVRLENLCADAWPAPVDEPLGAWRLRAAGGWTGRANAALVLGDPGLPVPDALEAVRSFAAGHGVEPRVHVPAGTPWERAIAAAGWVLDSGHRAGADVSVQVRTLDGVAAPPPGVRPGGTPTHDVQVTDAPTPDVRVSDAPTPDVPVAGAPTPDVQVAGAPMPDVQVTDAPTPGWWRLTGADTGVAARHVLTAPPTVAFLTGYANGADGGDAVAALRVAVVDDHAHLSLLAVAPAARRRGYARAVTEAGAGWAAERGARWAVLQVARHNAAALALYDRLGFTEHHGYRYLVPPPVEG